MSYLQIFWQWITNPATKATILGALTIGMGTAVADKVPIPVWLAIAYAVVGFLLGGHTVGQIVQTKLQARKLAKWKKRFLGLGKPNLDVRKP
jgi:hypothetical protein